MALIATPTSSTITAYGAPFRQPSISRIEQLWVNIWAKVVLLNNAGGTNYISNLGQLQQDAATLCAGMSRQEIEAALTGTYSAEATVIDPTNFPAVTSLSTLSTIISKFALMNTRSYDEYIRCQMLLRYQLLRLKAA